jgi:hypothetical protein
MSTSGQKVAFNKESLVTVYFRNHISAKVKTFREASSMAYEPIDVVDYVTIKGKIYIGKHSHSFNFAHQQLNKVFLVFSQK